MTKRPFCEKTLSKVKLNEPGEDIQDTCRLSGKPEQESKALLTRLRKAGTRLALNVATSLTLLVPSVTLGQNTTKSAQEPEDKVERKVLEKTVDAKDAYLATAEDFLVARNDTLKTRQPKTTATDSTSQSLLGYDLDTRFFRVGGSGKFKDGRLEGKLKVNVAKLSARKSWTSESGYQVTQGLSSRLRYEGVLSAGQQEGLDFESRHVGVELGFERRYDKEISEGTQFTHRYFAGARYRYHFGGEEEGNAVRGMVQAQQRVREPESFQVWGQDFGWEASSTQTLVARWGASRPDALEGVFEVQGLLSKDVDIKLLGKKRTVELKAGPEFKYSTQTGFSVGPEVGVKVRW